MDLAAAGSAGKVITLSSWMARRVREIYGISASVVRPGVDTELWRPTGKGGREPMVLSVGALWPFKGHETALESLSLLPEEKRPGLTIIADREYPGYSKRLLAMAERLGVCLEILMGVSDEFLVRLYNRASAVLCCQMSEPYGLVPLESMACGTPVVAVDEGGFPDNVRNGENGILVHRDPGTIAAALEGLFADEDLRRRLSDNGRLFVTEERTTEAAADSLRNILLDMLGE
jgi:glycosyltransferase involved in cell wall biosynthesis